MRRTITRAGVGVLALWVALTTARGQVDPGGAEQRTLQQVALGQARTQLFEQVRALPLGAGVTVAEWIAQDADLERALRLWVRAVPRHGSARLYDDGVCEIDATIAHAVLAAQLAALLEAYESTPAGVTQRSITAATSDWPVIWATGRATRPPKWQVERPPGWETVGADGLMIARRAAVADAIAALVDEAGRLALSGARRVRDFLRLGENVRDAVLAELQKRADVRVDFAPDRVAVADASIAVRELMRVLIDVQAEHDRAGQFAAADFRGMALSAERDVLRAAGLGVPPARTLMTNPYEPVEFNAPRWAETTLRAEGTTPAAIAEGSISERAERARLAAIDRLRGEVLALVIQQEVTVAEYVAYHQDLKDDIVLFLSSARPIAPPEALRGGGVRLRVELPLRRLWEIVRRKMHVEEVEPAPE